jgi:HAD superfamily hydrolase (TIGR01484 family)
MRYHALACDYDGTIARDGEVEARTIGALDDVKKSGRKLILVTGREIDDLIEVFPQLDVFDHIVAENGALLYQPSTRKERTLAEKPPQQFIDELVRRHVTPLSAGRVIVATWRREETNVREIIRDLGLDLEIIFNKSSVMILPSGVNKATGLAAALREIGLSANNVVGIGDAENDEAFLALCKCSVAVRNGIESIKARVDWTTQGQDGDGVIELIELLLGTDLDKLDGLLQFRGGLAI